MKIEIINKNHQYFRYITEPIKMNFESVLVEINGQKCVINRADTRIIAQNKYEEVIKECEDLLKIKLNRGISIVLYKAIAECIKEEINTSLRNIEVIKDGYKLLSKGRWSKDIIILVNGFEPFEINISGEKFNNKYAIKLIKVESEEFLFNNKQEIKNLDRQIEILKAKKEIYTKYTNRNNMKNCTELLEYCSKNVVL